MSEERRCETCGGTVPADAPGGLCPACLLGDGLGKKRDAGPPPLSPEELSALLPHLEVTEIIGRGGMGVVYRARQPALDRTVAVKLLPAHLGEDPAFTERFQREAKAMARLAHPNIVAVHEAGDVEGVPYLVMELVEGVNLRQAQDSGMTPAQALAIVPQICDALQFAHDRGVVHRDIKPENILLDRAGHVKITDFGLAKLVARSPGDPTLTGHDQVMGTWHYMAPEQMETPRDVDHRADIYSLGVVFYEMLTGELPVGRFAPPSSRAQVDAAIDEVVLRALERERERRWQRADDVKTSVETAQLRPAPPLAPTPVEVGPRRTSGLAVVGVLGVPVGILLAVAAALLSGGARESISLFFACALTFLVCALTGMILSLVAWARIRGNDRLGGFGLAITGTVLPVALVVLGAPAAFFLTLLVSGDDEPVEVYELNRHAPWEEMTEPAMPPPLPGPERDLPEREFLSPDDPMLVRSALAGLLRTLDESVGGLTDVDSLADLVDPRRRSWFVNLSAEEFKELHDREEGGLPTVDVNRLPARLSEYRIERIDRDGDRATATIVHEKGALRFPIVRRGGHWLFGVGKVERLPWPE